MKRSLKKNFILQVFYQILIILTPLFTAPYIARVLGPSQVGINSYSYAITSYFVMFAALGIENYGSRLIANNRMDKKKLDEVFSQLIFIHIIISVIVYFIFILYTAFLVKENKNVFWVQSFYILGIIFDVNWLFFGLEEFERIVVKNSVLKVLSVVLVFILVKQPSDLILYVGILSIGTFVNYAILWVGITKFVTIKRVKIVDCVRHIKPLVVLFLPAIAVLLYKYMDKIMLKKLEDSAAVGFYDSGERIIVLCLGLINALGVVMLPRISSLKAQGDKKSIEKYFDKSLFMIGFISIGCGFGVLAVASDFVPLFFGKGYEPSIGVMRGLAITLPFSAYANVAKTQYVLPNNRDSFFAWTLVGGAVINFIINYTLIPCIGINGATIGTICTEIFVCLVQLIATNREMNTFRKLIKVQGFLVIAIIMVLLINIFDFINNSFVRLVFKVIVGGLTYLLLSAIYCWFVDREMLKEISKSILKSKRRK